MDKDARISPATSLFRTFRLQHFTAAMKTRTMMLVRPHLWDDPFENLVSHCGIVFQSERPHRQVFLGNFRRPVYAQCWSVCAESDAH